MTETPSTPRKQSTRRRWLKRGLVAAVIVLLLGFGALETVRFVAFHRGASEVELPVGSEIRNLAEGADYTDAYQTPVAPVSKIEDFVFGMGQVVFQSENEIVWEAEAPGLRFFASYHLSEDTPPNITLSTVVFYESLVGHVYFFFVRPVHRRGVPFMVSEIGRGQASL